MSYHSPPDEATTPWDSVADLTSPTREPTKYFKAVPSTVASKVDSNIWVHSSRSSITTASSQQSASPSEKFGRKYRYSSVSIVAS